MSFSPIDITNTSLKYCDRVQSLFRNAYYLHGFTVYPQMDYLFLKMELHDADGELNTPVFCLDGTLTLYRQSRGKNYLQAAGVNNEIQFNQKLLSLTEQLLEEVTLSTFFDIAVFNFFPITARADWQVTPSESVPGAYDLRIGYDDLRLNKKCITPRHLDVTYAV